MSHASVIGAIDFEKTRVDSKSCSCTLVESVSLPRVGVGSSECHDENVVLGVEFLVFVFTIRVETVVVSCIDFTTLSSTDRV